jgi:hypothetical protein
VYKFFPDVESILLATIGLSPPPSLTATGRMFDELAARAHDPRPAGPVRARPAPAFHALGRTRTDGTVLWTAVGSAAIIGSSIAQAAGGRALLARRRDRHARGGGHPYGDGGLCPFGRGIRWEPVEIAEGSHPRIAGGGEEMRCKRCSVA